ncbi:hypothetical protein [Methylobacterium sp. J-068]|uniref:hypothetical protein n=1 Tax=Methylobacterium sp. J-068 TaxID=2836649 RepID=UPI001FBA4D9C|nr:hypothetical protein [Methylobacterium sp. J-068]MCJ2033045.1 hypothetical protein [Methylobacterium sp. J-068]
MALEEELFEIELDSIERTLNDRMGDAVYDVEFDCTRGDCIAHVLVSIDVEVVTTLEIVPFAMSQLHRAFVALAEQTKAWKIEPG